MSILYSRYVIGLISRSNTDDSPVSSLNCDSQQFVKLRGALRIVTGTCAGGTMGWPGMPWTLVFRSRPRCHEVTLGWFTEADDNQLYSGRTVWHGQSNLYYKASQFIPSIPLHHFTLTRLVNLDHHAAHSATHHQIHIPHTMHRVCAPRACPEFFTGGQIEGPKIEAELPKAESGVRFFPPRFPTSFSTRDILSWNYNIDCGLSCSHWGAIPPCPQSTLLLRITLESSGEASAPVCL